MNKVPQRLHFADSDGEWFFHLVSRLAGIVLVVFAFVVSPLHAGVLNPPPVKSAPIKRFKPVPPGTVGRVLLTPETKRMLANPKRFRQEWEQKAQAYSRQICTLKGESDGKTVDQVVRECRFDRLPQKDLSPTQLELVKNQLIEAIEIQMNAARKLSERRTK